MSDFVFHDSADFVWQNSTDFEWTKAGGSETTYPIASGSIALTGQSVGVTGNTISYAIASGTVTLTGQSVSLLVSYPIDSGAITLTGQSVGFGYTSYYSIASGSITTTGQSVSLLTSYPVASASVALTGQSVGFNTGGIYPIASGSITITGQTVSLNTSYPVSSATITLVGQTASLLISYPISSGSITTTGQSVGYCVCNNYAIASATITLTGQSVGLSIAYPIDSGVITTTGQSVGFSEEAGYYEIASGTITITGQVVGFRNTGTPPGVPRPPITVPIEELFPSPVAIPGHSCPHWHVDKDHDPVWDFQEQGELPYSYHKHPTEPHVCGHWHKNPYSEEPISYYPWYQPSVDIHNSVIGIVSMEASGARPSIFPMRYDLDTSAWSYGDPIDWQVIFAAPNTARLDENYLAFYCTGEVPDNETAEYAGRLYVWDLNWNVTETDVWDCDGDTGVPYLIDQSRYHNVMDCHDQTVVCVAQVYKENGIYINKWQIKISENSGVTFDREWEFPFSAALGTGKDENVEVRITADGYIWAGVVRYDSPTISQVELWKSDAGRTTLTKVWSKDYSLDTGTIYATAFGWALDTADGEHIVFNLPTSSTDRVLYVSDNFGSSFSTITVSEATFDLYRTTVIEGEKITVVAEHNDGTEGFGISEDFGTTFSFSSPGYNLGHAFVDMQYWHNQVVYTECGESYTLNDYQDIIYSLNLGTNWTLLTTPISITDGVATIVRRVNAEAAHSPVWEFTKQVEVY